MQKFPFTDSGLQDLLSQLYALDDQQLQQQADTISADFPTWLTDHFLFDQSQLNFLASAPESFIQSAAADCSYYVANRLPITMVKDQQRSDPPEEGEDRGKLIDLDKKSSASFSPPESHSSSGSLTITISYPQEP
jgi:hypothetical protein